MIMIGFIKLHEANEQTQVLLNVEHIVAIRDLRNDPVITGKDSWQWTDIECNNGRKYRVRETEQDINKYIKNLCRYENK